MRVQVSKKKIIVSLIKDDLINYKLVTGLNALGLNAQDYFQHLSETIFELMGFKDNSQTDDVFEEYLEQLKKAQTIDISNSREELELLSQTIYANLLLQLPKRK